MWGVFAEAAAMLKNKLRVFVATAAFTAALSTGAVSAQDANVGHLLAPGSEAELGKRLFEDANLSEPRGVSCASCHEPGKAFSGNNKSNIPAVAIGSRHGVFGTRRSPRLTYVSFSPKFGYYEKREDNGKTKLEPKGGYFWDGRASTLEEQAQVPLLNPFEMNNPSAAAIVAKVKASSYADSVKRLYGYDVFDNPETAMNRLAHAIAEYERSPVFAAFSSKFDDYLRGKSQLTKQEMTGFKLFTSKTKGNCIACHTGSPKSKSPSDWLFTDFTYDGLGLPRNTEIPANLDPKFFDLGLCEQPGLQAKLPASIDLQSQCGLFKAPSLRNVAVGGPYFHNGSIKTLREVVAIYATRDTSPDLWYPRRNNGGVRKYDDLPAQYLDNVNSEEVPYDRRRGQTARLDDDEIDAIVSFLKTLTDAEFKKPR
jgi:cytochrome c peroxidase